MPRTGFPARCFPALVALALVGCGGGDEDHAGAPALSAADHAVVRDLGEQSTALLGVTSRDGTDAKPPEIEARLERLASEILVGDLAGVRDPLDAAVLRDWAREGVRQAERAAADVRMQEGQAELTALADRAGDSPAVRRLVREHNAVVGASVKRFAEHAEELELVARTNRAQAGGYAAVLHFVRDGERAGLRAALLRANRLTRRVQRRTKPGDTAVATQQLRGVFTSRAEAIARSAEEDPELAAVVAFLAERHPRSMFAPLD